jgi:hypothetical protein
MATTTHNENKSTARLSTLKASGPWRGKATVYEVDPPFWGRTKVVVSQVDYGSATGGPETGVFPVTDEGDMDTTAMFVHGVIGAERPVAFAGQDDAGALALAGYEVVEGE